MSRATCRRGHDLTDPDVGHRNPEGLVDCRRCAALSQERQRDKRRRLIAEHGLDLDPQAPLYLIRQRIEETS